MPEIAKSLSQIAAGEERIVLGFEKEYIKEQRPLLEHVESVDEKAPTWVATVADERVCLDDQAIRDKLKKALQKEHRTERPSHQMLDGGRSAWYANVCHADKWLGAHLSNKVLQKGL